jgi:hypothetical protein
MCLWRQAISNKVRGKVADHRYKDTNPNLAIRFHMHLG